MTQNVEAAEVRASSLVSTTDNFEKQVGKWRESEWRRMLVVVQYLWNMKYSEIAATVTITCAPQSILSRSSGKRSMPLTYTKTPCPCTRCYWGPNQEGTSSWGQETLTTLQSSIPSTWATLTTSWPSWKVKRNWRSFLFRHRVIVHWWGSELCRRAVDFWPAQIYGDKYVDG